MNPVNIDHLIEISQKAGQIILTIYNQDSFETTIKSDQSPLTQADIASHLFICDALKKRYPAIPILSEESAEEYDYELRKEWDYFFLVDPLDGTKEFIRRNGEFTVNIALIKQHEPIMGVIHAPALDMTYYAEKNKGAYKIKQQQKTKLVSNEPDDGSIRAVVSRSHLCEQTKNFLADLEKQGKNIIALSAGSALKFGLIAEGLADIYPRFSPTMEWDTAAGQILVTECGKKMLSVDNEIMRYNKFELTNRGFVIR